LVVAVGPVVDRRPFSSGAYDVENTSQRRTSHLPIIEHVFDEVNLFAGAALVMLRDSR
jgi:hypothetical protein